MEPRAEIALLPFLGAAGRAEKRFAQAKARLQALRNREATKQRKLETRRKVILGGALIDLAGRDDRAGEMLERLLRNLVREQDRAAFDDWDWRAGSGEAVKDETAQREAARSGDADGDSAAPAAEPAPTRRRFIVPSNPNLHKEFLAQRRAGLSEE